ncbi:uncharacterized protein [Asterias amurensis]|uniref:uncharacterized protein n=1 Tax=Asterias amurensis TaxID=7602 RepID=UPI003AB2B3EA
MSTVPPPLELPTGSGKRQVSLRDRLDDLFANKDFVSSSSESEQEVGLSARASLQAYHTSSSDDLPDVFGSMPSFKHFDVSLPDEVEEPRASSGTPLNVHVPLPSVAVPVPMPTGNPTPERAADSIPTGTPTVTFKKTPICHICADREKTVFFLPCGHSMCMPCATHFQDNSPECPFCKEHIQSVRTIF